MCKQTSISKFTCLIISYYKKRTPISMVLLENVDLTNQRADPISVVLMPTVPLNIGTQGTTYFGYPAMA